DVTICGFSGGAVLQRLNLAGRVSCLAFSADGRRLAVGSATRARIWDCEAGKFITPELEHTAAITRLALDPRGELLATATADHMCRVFAVSGESDQPLFTPVRHYQIPFRPVGESPLPLLLADGGRGLLTVSTSDASFRDARKGQELVTL